MNQPEFFDEISVRFNQVFSTNSLYTGLYFSFIPKTHGKGREKLKRKRVTVMK